MKSEFSPQRVVEDIRHKAAKMGVKVVLNSTTTVEPILGNEAYFAVEPTPTIWVSKKGLEWKEWLPNLLHEYSHALQWYNNSSVWSGCYVDEDSEIDVVALRELWLLHKIELTRLQHDTYFKAIMELEIDAERKTLQLMVQYKLAPTLLELYAYTRQANVYLGAYLAESFYRKKIEAVAPYRNLELLHNASNTLGSIFYASTKTFTDFGVCVTPGASCLANSYAKVYFPSLYVAPGVKKPRRTISQIFHDLKFI